MSDFDEIEYNRACEFRSHEGRLISEFGDVLSICDWKIGNFLKPSMRKGYLTYCLKNNGTYQRVWVHHLVLKAFGFIRPSQQHQVRHLDGNKFNNHISNLKWGTVKENMNDKYLYGTVLVGEKCPNSKLKDHQAKEILLSPLKTSDLAKKYSVSRHTILRIKKRINWRHL